MHGQFIFDSVDGVAGIRSWRSDVHTVYIVRLYVQYVHAPAQLLSLAVVCFGDFALAWPLARMYIFGLLLLLVSPCCGYVLWFRPTKLVDTPSSSSQPEARAKGGRWLGLLRGAFG